MSTPPGRRLGFILAATSFAWNAWHLVEPLGRDQAVFLTLAHELRSGRIPYRDLFDHKPPGIIAVYALASLIDPRGVPGVALLDILAAAAATFLLVRALAESIGDKAALSAGLIYVLTSRSPCFGGFWATAQPEAFQDLALMLAVAAAARNRWVLCGAAVSMALALKFTLAAVVLVFGIWSWQAGGRHSALRLASGFAIPIVILVATLAGTHALGAAWDAVVVFNLHHAEVHVSISHMPSALLAILTVFLGAIPGALLLPLFAARVRPWPVAGTLAVALLLATLGQAIVQQKFWAWHFQPAALPLAALAGIGIHHLPGQVLPALLLTAASITSGAAQVREVQTRGIFDYLAGRVPREGLLEAYRWGDEDFSAAEVDAVGRYLADQAAPSDRLFVWGFEPGVYVRSGLSPGTRWLYDYPLTVGMPLAERHRAIDEVVASLPAIRWVVIFRNDANALQAQDSWTKLSGAPVLLHALESSYALVHEVGDALVLVRIDGRTQHHLTPAVGIHRHDAQFDYRLATPLTFSMAVGSIPH